MTPALRGHIRRLLIANRGEIAVRIIRTARRLGITPLVVYSPVDRDALHVTLAAQAFPLPADAPAESYLHIGRLIDVAKQAGADAVHPGYGFLSENPEFAEACTSAGLIFVGPPAEVLARCGDKVLARDRVARAGVPVLPGTGPITDADAPAAAEAVGYPLMIKAVGGGGGKGIHFVATPAELGAAMRLARGEAQTAFGDPRLYLERWLVGVRHVEVQVLGDHHGTLRHLGDRDCSVQRRHQKVIEEAPSPALTGTLRRRHGEAAIAAARALGYVNTGTVEFLLEGDRFFFIEINARLQVEHPVTEMVTGWDLVEAQLSIAEGGTLDAPSDEAPTRGHAVECRVSAEDPHHDFLPSVGVVDAVRHPAGPGIRVDSALAEGVPVSRHFDPLLAKVIAWGPTRAVALDRMAVALDEMAVAGVRTTLPFLRWAVRRPAFREGAYDVSFTEEWMTRPPAPHLVRTASIAAALWTYHERLPALPAPAAAESRWRRAARREGIGGGGDGPS